MSELTLLDVLNSIISSAAGAAGGVLGAQLLTDRSKLREQLLEEIRNTNTAIALASSIANTFFGAKMQHTKPMVDEFEAQKAAVLAHVHRGEPLNLRLNFNFIPPLRFPMGPLSHIVFEKLSAPTKAVFYAEGLQRASEDFNHFIDRRNDLIKEFKDAPQLDGIAILGLRTEGTDNRLRDFLLAILSANDDCIYHSTKLVAELEKHGEKTKTKLPRKFRDIAPRIVSANFDKAKDWMPDPAKHAEWEAMLIVRPEPERHPFAFDEWAKQRVAWVKQFIVDAAAKLRGQR